ncbi:fimbria/pilus outer membrane usher protein [Serratia marcescens]|uniref:fimbria/pilus outer membrane usher protein n=1 Tax=Serratia marcescens TaxID=615 RepID=UPI0002B854FC|nr:fimbria/pilus outer membrane usher protein [Serratia marcescens]EMF07029.1 fimbrial biogenesis outer membrane usher protein [Serratia marcescens VGH107]
MNFPCRTALGLSILTVFISQQLKAEQSEVQFDTAALHARGIDPRVAKSFRQTSQFMPGDTLVSLMVNGRERGKVNTRFNGQGQLCPTPEFIRAAGLLMPPGYDEKDVCSDLKKAWPQIEIHTDPGEGTVSLVVPQEAVAAQDTVNWQHGGVAGTLNYDVQYAGTSGKSGNMRYGRIETEAGFNADDWIVRSHQTMTRFNEDNTFSLGNVYAQRTLAEQKKILQVGQVSLSNSMFSTGQVLGFQFFPEAALQGRRGGGQVSGIADSQSVVEVRQSGVLVYSTTVPAGPFHLQGISLLNTRTDLDVSVTGADGNIHRFAVPASELLRNSLAPASGLSFGVGKLDQSGSDQSPLLGTVATGWQLTPKTALNTGILGSGPYNALAVSLDTQPLPATTLSLQGTAANDEQHDNRGMNGTAVATYQLADTVGLSASYAQQGQGYRELSDAIQDGNISADLLSKRQFGVGMNWSPAFVGTLAFSWSKSTTFSGTAYNYITGSWSRQFGQAYLGISLQHNTDSDDKSKEDRIYATLNIPFGSRSISSYVNNAGDGTRSGVRYSDRSSQGGGWGLSVDQDLRTHSNSVTGDADWVTPVSQLSGSLGQNQQTTSWSGRAIGAVVAHGHGVTLSPYPVSDTFGIAKVGEEGGVRLDTPAGPTWTDSHGYAVLPSLGGYRKSAVQVDTRSLAKNVDISNAWQETETARGAVSYVDFDVVKTRRVLADTRDGRGRALPHGASVFDGAGNFVTVVGNDGEIFLPDAHPGMKLDVQQSGVTQCRFTLALPEKAARDVLYETTQATCE